MTIEIKPQCIYKTILKNTDMPGVLRPSSNYPLASASEGAPHHHPYFLTRPLFTPTHPLIHPLTTHSFTPLPHFLNAFLNTNTGGGIYVFKHRKTDLHP